MKTASDATVQLRFGLKRQAIAASLVMAVGLMAATAFAYFWQARLSGATHQATHADMPQSVLAYQIALQASHCLKAQADFELRFRATATRRQAAQSWSVACQQLGKLAEQAFRLEENHAHGDALPQWRRQIDQYQKNFLAVAGRVDSGELHNQPALHEALRGSYSEIEQIVREAQSQAALHGALTQQNGEKLEELVQVNTQFITLRALIAFLLLASATLWVLRSMLTRIGVLSAAVQRFTSGSHGTRIACDANDELGILGRQFNEMASTIQMNEEQLRRARDVAQTENRGKSEFLAALSEELARPMKMILDYTETLLGSLDDSDNRQAVDTMRQGSEYLVEVVNSLLDLSKIELGNLSITPIVCSPCQVVAEVCSVMRRRAEGKRLGLDVQYAGPVPESLLTDPIRLRQILLHVIDDAVRATQFGSVLVLIRFLSSDVSRLQFEVCSVESGGLGQSAGAALLPPADYSYRTRSLGLTIARRLTHLLGGDVSVTGDPGSDGTVTLTMPVQVPANVRMIERPGESILLREKELKNAKPLLKLDCHILLAEDGPESQRLISFILKRAGAEVTVVDNGKQAVDRILAECQNAPPGGAGPFDAVLMDIDMPLMDGCEAAQRLRQAGYDGLIIAVTGHAKRYDRNRCLHAGFDDYVTKPLDRSTLLQTLARHSVRLGEPAQA